jgi:phosphoglycerol transferase MdoB-like AlkP superfamily enzyme
VEPVSFIVSILIFIVFIITVVSIARNPNHGALGKFVWIVVAFFLSVLGSVLWLIFGRGRVNR